MRGREFLVAYWKMHPLSGQLLRWLCFPLLLGLLGFVQYANTFGHDYAWDDKLVITANPVTQKGWAGIPEIVSSKVSVPNKNVYRPVAQVVFALEVEAFGLDPRAGHVFSALWYGLLCVVVYGFLRMVFPGVPALLHFLCVGLFAVHPLHVEVVANIKSRDEILAMLLGLLGVMGMLKGVLREGWGWVLGGMALMGLAMLAKQNAVTLLPVLLLAYAYRVEWRLWDRRSLLVGAATLGLLGMFLQHGVLGLGGVLLLGGYALLAGRRGWIPLGLVVAGGLVLLLRQPAVLAPTDGYTLVSEASALNNVFMGTEHPELVRPSALANLVRYLELFVWPHPLVHLYGYNQVPMVGYGDGRAVLGVLLLLLGLMVVLAGLRRRSPVAFGLVFFLCTFSIYSNYWVTVPDTMADRFMFMPSLGLCLVVVYLLDKVVEGLAVLRGRLLAPQVWVAVACVPVGVAFFVHTWHVNLDWENDHTLIHNRIAYMEENAAAQAMMGFVLHGESQTEPNPVRRQEMLREVLQRFHKALSIYPAFYTAWVESGKVFAEVGLYDKAELCFLRAIQLEPLSPESHIHLGTLYSHLKAPDYAIPYYEQAIELNPYHAEVMNQLGMAYYAMEDAAGLRRVAEMGRSYWPEDNRFVNLMGLHHMVKALPRDSITGPENLMDLGQGDSIRNF